MFQGRVESPKSYRLPHRILNTTWNTFKIGELNKSERIRAQCLHFSSLSPREGRFIFYLKFETFQFGRRVRFRQLYSTSNKIMCHVYVLNNK